jgi:hypothetical protein
MMGVIWYSRYHSKHYSADTPDGIVTYSPLPLYTVKHPEIEKRRKEEDWETKKGPMSQVNSRDIKY